MRNLTADEKLGLKLTNRGRINLHDWFERVVEDYISEQVVEDRTSLDRIKENFYTDLHKGFLCTIPTILRKFLLDKGVGDIVEYRPRLGTLLPNSNYQERDKEWEGFLDAKCKDTRQA
jgi:hypothetical protein